MTAHHPGIILPVTLLASEWNMTIPSKNLDKIYLYLYDDVGSLTRPRR